MGLSENMALAHQDHGGVHGEGQDRVQSVLAALDAEARLAYIQDDKQTEDRDDGMPEWFDEGRYKRGNEAFEEDIFLMFAGKLAGLIAILAVPSIVKVLLLTRKSEESHKAFRRYVDTIRHMLFWYRTSVTDPKSPCRESLAIVRRHHVRGSTAARRAGHPGISQLDMVLTQFAFCGFIVLRRKHLHLQADDQQMLDFLHMWRTIGFLLGIPDKYNICQFDTNIAHSETLLEAVCEKWLKPALVSPPEEFELMSRALINGIWCMMPIVEYTSYLNFTQELAGVPTQHRPQPKTTWSLFMFALIQNIPPTLSWPLLGPLFRHYHNANMRFSIFMSTYYPLLAWYSFPGMDSTRYQQLVSSEI